MEQMVQRRKGTIFHNISKCIVFQRRQKAHSFKGKETVDAATVDGRDEA